MNKKFLSALSLAFCLISVNCMAQSDSSGKGKVGTAINKIGNKTAHVAVSGASVVADKKYAAKVGPQGQTIYINKNDHYYYVNGRGKKVYVSKSKLKTP
jgi:hypothetical protein